MNGLLGLTDRDRPRGGYAPGYSDRGVQQIRGFDDPIDKSPCLRLCGGEGKARKDQLLGPALANSPGQILGTACSRHYSKRHLRQCKARMCGGIDEIRSRGDLTAAAIGCAVDSRQQRDRTSHYRPNHSFEDGMLRLPAFVAHPVALLEIS